MQKDNLKTESNNPNVLLEVRCINNHPEGLTKGKTYNVVGESKQYYNIKPDDYGHLSGFDKRYFESVGNDR